jgi:hypothetical protein
MITDKRWSKPIRGPKLLSLCPDSGTIFLSAKNYIEISYNNKLLMEQVRHLSSVF